MKSLSIRVAAAALCLIGGAAALAQDAPLTGIASNRVNRSESPLTFEAKVRSQQDEIVEVDVGVTVHVADRPASSPPLPCPARGPSPGTRTGPPAPA